MLYKSIDDAIHAVGRFLGPVFDSMVKHPYMAIFFIIVIGLAIGILTNPSNRRWKRIWKKHISVEIGMTEKKVRSLLGKPNERSLSENGYVTCVWGGKKHYIEIIFKDEVVVSVNTHGR